MKRTVPYFTVMVLALAGLVATQRSSPNKAVGEALQAARVPASVSLVTIALGPMRALVTNVLWWRAIDHQDRGEFFDVVQLSEWITELQPNMGSVWGYLGWNMAYNVSYEFSDPEDQWGWIENGIELLRDRGLRANPDWAKNQRIRHELARIFYQKIERDEFFRTRWTFKMMEYFDLGTRTNLLNLDAAASSLEELRTRPNVAAYAEAAQRELGIDIFDFAAHPPPLGGVAVSQPPQERHMASVQVHYCWARMRIERDLKLDIKRMLKINREFGPFDWRSNQAHAVYWAAEDDWEAYLAADANYAEVVRQSMINSFFKGRVLKHDGADSILYTANLENIERIHNYYDRMIVERYSYTIDMAHKKFLQDAVAILYQFDRAEDARKLYGHYQADYDDETMFESFVLDGLARTVGEEDARAMKAAIESLIYKHMQWLDAGDFAQANGYFKAARLIHRRNWRENPPHSRDRVPQFVEMATAAKKRYFADNPRMNMERMTRQLGRSLEVRKALESQEIGVGSEWTPGEKLARPEDAGPPTP